MRSPYRVLSFLLSFAVVAQTTSAQPVSAPVIQNVTVNADSNAITITGTGLGPDLLVTVDAQSLPLLPGATSTQIEVQAPATVLTTPGTYRLTVVDPVRRAGDAFIVATVTAAQVGIVEVDRARPSGRSSRATSDQPAGRVAGGAESASQRGLPNAPSPMVIEGPSNTAIGSGALAANTTGQFNTASGVQALSSNTTGSKNAAHGAFALYSNTTGSDNTASGEDALFSNTTAAGNTAVGARALKATTISGGNTAVGADALTANTTGCCNTATGGGALSFNTTGYYNTATGAQALWFNTTGRYNTATGMQALQSNSTGQYNTAAGIWALFANTTGSYNTATGESALALNATGINNVATGAEALNSNSVGNDNTATGTSALYNNTASFNTAHGTSALYNLTDGQWNTALGDRAGLNATTGSYNVYVGAGVGGTAADTNTIRLGVPYDSGTGAGQNQTFVAGIYGTQLSGNVLQVFVDPNGKLGTLNPPQVLRGTGTVTVSQLQQQIVEQQHVIDDLRERLAQLEALVRGKVGRR